MAERSAGDDGRRIGATFSAPLVLARDGLRV